MLAEIALSASTEAYASDYYEVLLRFFADRKISGPEIRGRFEGEYGWVGDADRQRTWNVETALYWNCARHPFMISAPAPDGRKGIRGTHVVAPMLNQLSF